MENPLTQIYFIERCNVCGATYPVTLYAIYREQHLSEEWHTARPCPECDQHQAHLVRAVPVSELAELARAWERLAAALDDRGLAYHVGEPPPAADHHPAGSSVPSA